MCVLRAYDKASVAHRRHRPTRQLWLRSGPRPVLPLLCASSAVRLCHLTLRTEPASWAGEQGRSLPPGALLLARCVLAGPGALTAPLPGTGAAITAGLADSSLGGERGASPTARPAAHAQAHEPVPGGRRLTRGGKCPSSACR